MASNPIGIGTANMLVNVPAEEKSLWGRLSVQWGLRSVAELQRVVMEKGLEAMDPKKAQELRLIRRNHRNRVGSAAMFLLLSVSIVHSWTHPVDPIRRAKNSARMVRVTKVVRPVRAVRGGRGDMEMELAA